MFPSSAFRWCHISIGRWSSESLTPRGPWTRKSLWKNPTCPWHTDEPTQIERCMGSSRTLYWGLRAPDSSSSSRYGRCPKAQRRRPWSPLVPPRERFALFQLVVVHVAFDPSSSWPPASGHLWDLWWSSSLERSSRLSCCYDFLKDNYASEWMKKIMLASDQAWNQKLTKCLNPANW